MRKPLVFLLAGCGVSAGLAAEPAASPPSGPLYNVEIVVFRTLAPVGTPEQWSAEAGASSSPSAADSDTKIGAGTSQVTPPAPAGSVAGAAGAASAGAVSAGAVSASASSSASTNAAAGTPANGAATIPPAAARPSEPSALVRLLPSTSFQLNGLESRLRTSGRYAPVAHAAWTQTASPWGKPSTISLTELGIAVTGLSGTVALERGTFLHLDLQLDYLMPDPPAGLQAAPGTLFTLHQVHRVRYYQRNFFDHPAFGVLALVTPAQGPRRAGR